MGYTSIIGSAAYLDLCTTCGRHGFIRLADGRISQPIISKEEAHGYLRRGADAGLISAEEELFIIEQIEESTLAERQGDARLLEALWLVETRRTFLIEEERGTFSFEDGFAPVNTNHVFTPFHENPTVN